MFSWLKQQVVGSNPASNLKLFMLVSIISLPLHQLSFLPVEIPQDETIINDKKPFKEQCTMFTDLSLQVTLSRVPSSLTSHYRSPQWVRQSGQLQSLQVSLYRSPQEVPSLLISHYRSLPIRKMEKKVSLIFFKLELFDKLEKFDIIDKFGI